MLKKLLKKFTKRGKYASPYYGAEALGSAPAAPLIESAMADRKPVLELPERAMCPKPNAVDWEQRRFELLKMLIAQERRSVVLGKLQASNKQIANMARVLADAGIRELMNHPMDFSHDGRRESDDQ